MADDIHFRPGDEGCYADGAFGHVRVRERLADLVWHLPSGPALAEELRGPMSDDAGEETDALDLLNRHSEGIQG